MNVVLGTDHPSEEKARRLGVEFVDLDTLLADFNVFEKEPLPVNDPLTKLESVVLTPHIAFLTQESLEECTYVCVQNIERFIEGRPQNVVNPEVITSLRLP